MLPYISDAVLGPDIAFARKWAVNAHGGQKRKYTGEPYWYHLEAVANIIMEAEEYTSRDQDVAIAALLHDAVEDTSTTIQMISEAFGPSVAQLVSEVTDVSKQENGRRAIRKAIDRAHLSGASPEGKTIKLADIIDNTNSIVEHDKDFAVTYLAEKALLMPCLRGGYPSLYIRAEQSYCLAIQKLTGFLPDPHWSFYKAPYKFYTRGNKYDG